MTSGVGVRVPGTSNSRTIVGSGSARHRSVGRVRRRVNTNDTGSSPGSGIAGGRTTSIVGSSPTSISANPTAARAGPIVGSGATTDSIVIVTVLGPVVGSISMRWPSQ